MAKSTRWTSCGAVSGRNEAEPERSRSDLQKPSDLSRTQASLSMQIADPMMTRVDTFQSVYQPAALSRIKQRQHARKVGIVLRLIVLRFEQEHDLRNHVGDPILGRPDDLRIRTPDPPVTTTDPYIAVVGLAKDVEAVGACLAIANPRLVHRVEGFADVERPDVSGADHIEVELRKGPVELLESARRNRDLRVLVHPRRDASVEIDRPAAHDAPGDLHSA
jgi:hypothetical protein